MRNKFNRCCCEVKVPSFFAQILAHGEDQPNFGEDGAGFYPAISISSFWVFSQSDDFFTTYPLWLAQNIQADGPVLKAELILIGSSSANQVGGSGVLRADIFAWATPDAPSAAQGFPGVFNHTVLFNLPQTSRVPVEFDVPSFIPTQVAEVVDVTDMVNEILSMDGWQRGGNILFITDRRSSTFLNTSGLRVTISSNALPPTNPLNSRLRITVFEP